MTMRITERYGQEIVLLDSIDLLAAGHRGKVVVSGSHGGLGSGRTAIRHPPKLVVFNDAGIGKDRAGIAALDLLDGFRIAALTVAAGSARIGDAEDTLEHGIISHLNAAAAALGLASGNALRTGLAQIGGSGRARER